MVAIYYKIYEFYKKQITVGQLKCGSKMPTEEQICDTFSCSRITARHALEMLSNQGYIVKIQGKGTYVNEKKTLMQLNELMGFSAEMKRLGKTPSTIVLGVSVVEANENVANKLKIAPNKQIYVIERIRCADDVKVALEKVSIPFYFVPGLDKYDLAGSLYAILIDEFDIVPKWATESIEATLANQKIADALDVKPNSPVLAMERTSYDENDKIYEYTESVYRGDKYKFSVTMN
ncbi:MAG: GntR family transcriptional regulator [Clostridia bacterium]